MSSNDSQKAGVQPPQPPPANPSDINSDIEKLLLTNIAALGIIDNSWSFAAANNLDHQQLVGVLKSLVADRYLTEEMLESKFWTLTDEGKDVIANGSPEIQVLKLIPAEGGISLSTLNSALGDTAKIGMGVCMKNKWVEKNGDMIVALKRDVVDETVDLLGRLDQLDEKSLLNLKKRKLVTQVTRRSFRIHRGSDFQVNRVKRVADLTKGMLGRKEDVEVGNHWSDLAFKPVNLRAMGAVPQGGNFHPLMKVRAEFRRILLDMGFEEMPTNKWVESSFWNFDSLFQPQSHPARDAHDTFFIRHPAETRSVPEEYYERVKTIHESGGYGSIGYGCSFKREEAMKNLLRTHTTAISAQMLYRLAEMMKAAQGGEFKAKKYFSIDRVFRNEAMDATHLCEFHQVEGFVADRNLTLGNLIGVIKTFFEKIGITQLRFKPAYNPYTEPSMEIFGYHPELRKWTEIGNSGMFRPEMLLPMGLPSDVRVIAWGLSLERPTMIKYRIENIRDLFGHKADLNKQRNAPIARFDSLSSVK